MIPLADADRRPLHFPLVTALIIGTNVLVFVLELFGGDAFVSRWALVPANIMAGRNWITILTAMFMHGGWVHILGNMVFFWVFGPRRCDGTGSLPGLLPAGRAGSDRGAGADPAIVYRAQFGGQWRDRAVMGTFLITFPRDRIRTLLLFGWFARVTVVPAVVLVGLWFLTQVFSEVGALATTQTGGVAYMAHIGGFVFGMAFGRLFEGRRLRAQQGLE